MPALGLALGLPFSQRFGGLFPPGVAQWLAAPDSDGAITDKRSLLSLPTYTNNNCKAFDGVGDSLESSDSLNIGSNDFEMSLEMRLDNASQTQNSTYFGRWGLDSGSPAGNVAICQRGGNHIYFVAMSHEGETCVFKTPIASLGTSDFHTFKIVRSGTTLSASIDGVSKGSKTILETDTFFVNRKILTGTCGPCTKTHAYIAVDGVRVVEYTYASGPSTTEWDRSGNGNHGVYTTTSGTESMATTSDQATPWNILNGFSLYTHATLPVLRVPYDINGDPLSITPPTGYTLVSEHPGGYLHNGAESTVTRPDKRSLLSRPVYTGNNCKKFDGQGDRAIGQTVNIGSADFELGICLKLLNISQTAYGRYWGRWESGGTGYPGGIAIRTEGTNTTAAAQGHSGTTYLTNALTRIRNSVYLGTDVFHTLAIKRVGTSLMWMLDGVSRYTATVPAEETFMVDRQLLLGGISEAAGPCLINCAWLDIAGVRAVNLTCAEGPDLTIYNQVVGGTHFAITTTSGIDTMATMDDNATPWNILNGFSLYTHATLDPIRVPYDINGDPLSITPPTGYTLVSEHPGGYLHNGAESTITQTDNFFIDGTINFYSADGATQDDKTYADFLAHEPFKDNLLLQWKSVGGVCLGCEAMQRPLAYVWTKAMYKAALAFMHEFTSDCGAKIFTVTEPTGGWLRTYDPNTATAGDAYDFLATLVHDMHTGFPTYAVTEPTGGWVRTFDSMDEDLTIGTMLDVLATIAHDIGSTVQAYALNTGGTELYTYNPNTATFNNAANVLYSLMLKLKRFGFIL